MTQSELYLMPDDDLRHELVDGRLVSEPPPGFRHGRTAAVLTCALENYAQAHGQHIAVTCDVGFCLSCNPDTVRAPDVAIVERTRLDSFDDDQKYFPGPPDLAIEVLSPSDRAGEVQRKAIGYLRSGAQAVWLVDNVTQSIRVCKLDGDVRYGVNDVLTVDSLLPGFTLPVREIFS